MKEENIKRYTIEETEAMIAGGGDRTDWRRVEATTDEEIEAAIRDDPDWEGLQDIDWSTAVWVTPRLKTAVSIRLDNDIIEFFKKDGRGYQSRINSVLRHFMRTQKKAAE